MQLNPKQQAAVLHAEGPAMVVAGPGSGKTAVLTRRIDRLIRGLHVPPEKIMVITFTRAAAEEMKSRFQAFPEEAEAPVFFATFHAAFYRILRR
ncbi:MAG: UvrD-helicase domain-containing protein, partial [Acetatifactor sp.]|nr:UvrD-helicase domain-containing protein [Acetatifactor sp.]